MKKFFFTKYSVKKVIAMLCVFVMTFCFAPMNVFAQSIRQSFSNKDDIVANEKIQLEDGSKTTNYKDKKILMEDTERRSSNEKHYILEDGTRIATIFPSNIHYKENGKFVDIDNTLETKIDTKDTLKLSKEELSTEINIKQNIEENKTTEIYENKANSFKTKFTNKTKDHSLGSITSGEYTLTWRLKNANSTENPVITNTEGTRNVKGLKINEVALNQVTSSVKYTNLLNNINVEYTIEPEKVKEDIILSNKDAIDNNIVFEYDTNGLDMRLTENNDIIVYKGSETKFVIKSPFMYDSKLEFSDDIDIQLKKQNKKYELTITPNKEWLNAEERVYPITLDPTIQTSLYVQNIDDTFIYKGDTNNTTRHNAHILRVGNGSVGNRPIRSLIKFSLPTLNSGDQVIAAELSIRNYPDNSEWNPPTDQRIFDVHRVTENWTGSSVNWANISTKYDTKVIDYIKYKYTSSDPKMDNRFDITALVKDWYTTGNNYGVMIKEHKEYDTTTSTTDAYFFSANTSGAYLNYRPKIVIAYRNQTGLEDYLSYHAQSVGRAGTVYTNDYNGNLTLVHTDAATPGNRLPVTIEHVYNTNEKDVDIGYGKGVRLNLSQMLTLETISSTEYIKYIDEDATAHYFTKNSTTNIYEDEDGLGLKISTSDNNKIMTDKSGNTMIFEKYSGKDKWHLKTVKDTSNNSINLTLTTINNEYVISKATDAVGDELTLTYSSGRLQKITDKAGRVTNYTYDTNGRLITITYSDNKTSNYSYGDNNEITRVKNIDNSYMDYTYYPRQCISCEKYNRTWN